MAGKHAARVARSRARRGRGRGRGMPHLPHLGGGGGLLHVVTMPLHMLMAIVGLAMALRIKGGKASGGHAAAKAKHVAHRTAHLRARKAHHPRALKPRKVKGLHGTRGKQGTGHMLSEPYGKIRSPLI